jgi:hypothetical protein
LEDSIKAGGLQQQEDSYNRRKVTVEGSLQHDDSNSGRIVGRIITAGG